MFLSPFANGMNINGSVTVHVTTLFGKSYATAYVSIKDASGCPGQDKPSDAAL